MATNRRAIAPARRVIVIDAIVTTPRSPRGWTRRYGLHVPVAAVRPKAVARGR